jgi:hypothetical protein
LLILQLLTFLFDPFSGLAALRRELALLLVEALRDSSLALAQARISGLHEMICFRTRVLDARFLTGAMLPHTLLLFCGTGSKFLSGNFLFNMEMFASGFYCLLFSGKLLLDLLSHLYVCLLLCLFSSRFLLSMLLPSSVLLGQMLTLLFRMRAALLFELAPLGLQLALPFFNAARGHSLTLARSHFSSVPQLFRLHAGAVNSGFLLSTALPHTLFFFCGTGSKFLSRSFLFNSEVFASAFYCLSFSGELLLNLSFHLYVCLLLCLFSLRFLLNLLLSSGFFFGLQLSLRLLLSMLLPSSVFFGLMSSSRIFLCLQLALLLRLHAALFFKFAPSGFKLALLLVNTACGGSLTLTRPRLSGVQQVFGLHAGAVNSGFLLNALLLQTLYLLRSQL